VARTLPIYVLSLEGALSPDTLELIPEAKVVSSLEELLGPASGYGPGWVLLPARTPAELLISALSRLGGEGGEWAPLLVSYGDAGPTVTPLLFGYPEDLEGSLPRIRGEEANTGLLSFRALLQDLSRIRHDINNPLTAAFAEVQLQLMDAEPGSESMKALSVVEGELYRIRDLVAELSSFRSPIR
jgi:signal transduction histidine kinase